MKKEIITFFLALFCIFGYAQTIDPVLLQEMEQKRGDDKIDIIVIMKSQYDRTLMQRRADYYTTRAERREFVVNELKQFAESSQYDLRKTLEEMERQGMTTGPKIIWIANAMYFSATKQAINDLAMRRDIEIIGLDEKKQEKFDDEEFHPISTRTDISWNLSHVGADQVWQMGFTGKGVLVAILDTGVNYNHVDLADHLWDGGEEYPNHGWDFCNDDNDPMDESGHGTSCAGIICGDGTAGCQVGMAPDATLMCVRVKQGDVTQATHICSGMQWAIEHGADLINMSIGIMLPSITEKNMIRNTCVAVLDAGVTCAASLGNKGNSQNPDYEVPNNVGVPAGCPPPYMDPTQMRNPGGLSCVISAGAVDAEEKPTNSTSHGPVTWADTDFADYPYTPESFTEFGLIRPDLVAPGTDIVSLYFRGNSRYTTGGATSSCAPCVTGCMALLLSLNPNLTPADLCRILEETAVTKTRGKNNIIGYGRVDALAAFSALTGVKGDINFADPTVKEICVSLWDSDGDGELSYFEAAMVDSLEFHFQGTGITTFRELQYFTGIKRIRPGEFANCTNLTTIDIPNGVISIGKAAFDSCSNLTFIMMHAPRMSGLKVPNLYEGVFDGANSSLTIYVPYGSLNKYKTATTWEGYASMIYPWMKKGVNGYGKFIENGRWAFIASPLVGNTVPKAIEGMIADTATNYDLYRFNQEATDFQWENYKSNFDDFVLENGQGYLYGSKEDADLIFKGEFNEGTTKEVALACSGEGVLKGWNLVGNPFPYSATVTDRSFYVMNSMGTGLNPNAGSSGMSVPGCTGIFVKAEPEETDPVITFEKPGLRAQSTSKGLLEISLINANSETYDEEDRAIISFNEGDQLRKLYFNNDNASIYIPQDNHEYAIAVSNPFGSTPLNFVAKENGQYALTIYSEKVEMRYLHLIDNLTGDDIDLLQTPSYTFTGKTTDYAARFNLVFASKDGNPLDDNDELAFFAIYSGGCLIVPQINGEQTLQVVDVLGRVLFSETVTDSFEKPLNLTPGIYVIRLNERVQKIVVR